jgi:hypothetical protein
MGNISLSLMIYTIVLLAKCLRRLTLLAAKEIVNLYNPNHCRIHTLKDVLAALHDHPNVPSRFVMYLKLNKLGIAIPTIELVGRMDIGRMCGRYSLADERTVTGAVISCCVLDDFVKAAIRVGAEEVHLR